MARPSLTVVIVVVVDKEAIYVWYWCLKFELLIPFSHFLVL